MNKSRIFILVLLIILFVSLKTLSHAPTRIDMDFDNENKLLKLEIYHPVLLPGNHYIKTIEVYLNDNLRIVQNFDRQMTKKTQKAGYFIFEAKKGDIIKVKAICSKHGDKTVSLVVREKK